MFSRTAFDSPVHYPGILEAATKCLQNSPYQAVRRVLCECDHGILFLRGHLPTFYQKQRAQEAVAKLKGVLHVMNETVVDTNEGPNP